MSPQATPVSQSAHFRAHGTSNHTFSFGVSEDRGSRRTMEDEHQEVIDFGGIIGQGFFAVFDGHAGKQAANWCANHFHETFRTMIDSKPDSLIPDVLNDTFHKVDGQLVEPSQDSGARMDSGCTAVTAFLRLEDNDGRQSFLSGMQNGSASKGSPIVAPESCRRVLYCANAGDARAVLCRRGRAVRLTYDHKGTDKQEQKRITDAGGFVLSGRVNGVLAVTRSLGDATMKQFVVGAPYTTETELCDEDELLILASDGLWDVVSDQQAVDHIRDTRDAQEASKKLKDYAIDHHTTDNVTVIVVRFCGRS